MKKYFWNLFLILCFVNLSFSQELHLSGKVVDSLFIPVGKANIILKKTDSLNKIQFVIADEKGKFKLPVVKNTLYELEVSSLGFETYKKAVFVKSDSIETNVVLQTRLESLQAVHIEARKPIEIKKDTTVFNASSFLYGTERNVEDLLKNLPGVEVGVDGSITVDDIPIEKIMINNEDFVGRQYGLISKNLTVDAVETVELIDRYQENKLFHNILDSNKKALNLNLKEEYNSKWFGNLNVGYDVQGADYHRFQINLMNMGGKTKFYILGNSNNSGLSTGASRSYADYSGGFNPNLSSIASGNYLSPYFYSALNSNSLLSNRTNRRISQTSSLSSITNFNDNVKLTNKLVLHKNRGKSRHTSIMNYHDEEGLESIRQRNRKTKDYTLQFNSHLELELSTNESLKIKGMYLYKDGQAVQNNILNAQPISENSTLKNSDIDFTANYVNRINSKSLWSVNANYTHIDKPENYRINDFIYNDLFLGLNGDQVMQNLKNRLQFATLNSAFAVKQNHKLAYDFKVDFVRRKEDFNNLVYVLDGSFQDVAENFSSKQYNLEHNFLAKASLEYKLNAFKINSGARTKYAKIQYSRLNKKIESSFTYISPFINLEYKINSKYSLDLGYVKGYRETPINSIYTNYLLSNLHYIVKGFDKHSHYSTQRYYLDFYKGNRRIDKFLMTSSVSYSNANKSFTNRILVEPNYNYYEKTLGEGTYYWDFSQKFEYYFSALKLNADLRIAYLIHNRQTAINADDFSTVYNYTWNYNLILNSNFKGFFDYRFTANYFPSKVKSQNTYKAKFLTSDLELLFNLNKKFNSKINLSHHNYYNKGAKSIQFIDLSSNYTALIGDKEFKFDLEIRNLLNKKSQDKVQISDLYTYQSLEFLLERMVLVSLNFSL